MSTLSTIEPAAEIEYPSSPEEPMPQTEWHRDLTHLLLSALLYFFRAVDRICVSGDLFVYYEKGDKTRVVAPDIFVARGVARRERDTYRVWEEGRGPEFVIEIISDSTRHNDMGRKRDLYRDVLKVSEYFVFDPDGQHLDPRLQGFRLEGEAYVPIAAVEGRLPSNVTGLHLEAAGRELRFWNPATEAWVPTYPECVQAAEDARQAAEDEVARLRRELDKLRGGQPPAP